MLKNTCLQGAACEHIGRLTFTRRGNVFYVLSIVNWGMVLKILPETLSRVHNTALAFQFAFCCCTMPHVPAAIIFLATTHLRLVFMSYLLVNAYWWSGNLSWWRSMCHCFKGKWHEAGVYKYSRNQGALSKF